jgi:glycine/D-amino acid oxidase-like deaminating enzyme
MEEYDVVLIGAGHNGLVCAAYLLKAGYTVLLLEKIQFLAGRRQPRNCYQNKPLASNSTVIGGFRLSLRSLLNTLKLSRLRKLYSY